METCQENFKKLQDQLIEEHNQKLEGEKAKYLSIIQ
jgi:hypothetical protein